MVRRLVVVGLLVCGGLSIAPSSASADMCEWVAYVGLTTANDSQCVPYSGTPDCHKGFTELGIFGTVWDEICLPAT